MVITWVFKGWGEDLDNGWREWFGFDCSFIVAN